MVHIFAEICYKNDMTANLHTSEFLRERAAQFRRIASTCDLVAAAKLLELAIELDARAAELDHGPSRRSAIAQPCACCLLIRD